MRRWRGMAMLCSLALGCGGPLPDEGIQEDGRSRASSPSEQEEVELTAEWGRVEPGTARLVKDIFPMAHTPPWHGPEPESLVAFRGKLYFAANFEDGRRELWKSDGTTAGTVPVKRFLAPSGIPLYSTTLTELTPLGSRLFFVVGDETHGRELWVSDGTTGGTRLLKDITPGPEGSEPYRLTVVGNTLLFFRYIPGTDTTPSRHELWRSNGTEAGTVRVKDLGPETALIYSQAIVGNTLFFAFSDLEHGTELWKTDGTEAGTGLVTDIVPGANSSYPFHLTALGGRVFFTATDPVHGTTVWRTDGTAAGTERVADLIPGTDNEYVQLLGTIGGCLYLAAPDPSDQSTRLYRLKDGTAGIHVKLVTTLPNPYSDPDASTYITASTVAGRKLFLALGIYGSGPAPRDVQLWVTDGTDSGTKPLHSPLSTSDEFGSTLYALDGRILFSGADGEAGLELWESDGTVRGTRQLQDIAPGGTWSYPHSFIRVGSKVFFVAQDGVHGSELWVMPLRR
ncbi:ELWxxDGT repeat protein [Archangium lipolyticum]|uniref:ELWxxDGT repeat protein n=1 Tax=Archangium lipolyticum TaxID=2970465 RepID=UPI00214A62F1|nr:ELWxxDGT repeat protein [Archangium lipolyticum]